jgi:succinate-acetate transporter protein
MLLMIGFLYPSENATKAGGSFGILTSAIAWYGAWKELTPEDMHLSCSFDRELSFPQSPLLVF